jgi:hypothetical protein
MNGAQAKGSGDRQVHTMMWLRRKEIDASNINPGWKSFSEIVASLVGGPKLQARHFTQVARSSSHQWSALRRNVAALTSGSSGSQTFRCAPSLLTTNPSRYM